MVSCEAGRAKLTMLNACCNGATFQKFSRSADRRRCLRNDNAGIAPFDCVLDGLGLDDLLAEHCAQVAVLYFAVDHWRSSRNGFR